MGLTLASEAGFLASARGIVSSEAADTSRLAWAAISPGVDSAPIQSALLGYLQATRAPSRDVSSLPEYCLGGMLVTDAGRSTAAAI